MEARRRKPWWLAALLVPVLTTSTVAYADDFRGDIEGNRVTVGGEQGSNVQQAGHQGNSPGGSDAQSSPSTPSGPIIETRRLVDCPGVVPDSDQELGCVTAELCPSDDPDAEPQFRRRVFQRELDRETGEPLTDWQFVGTECVTAAQLAEDEEAQGPSLIELVISEWQSLQIPSAQIGISPPGGQTLVNFETIFYTETGQQEYPVTLLGQSVIIYAIPVEYTWHHGDGSTQTTTSPGAPYPRTDITYSYTDTGVVAPRVDVRYRAEFTVNGGERQSIPGFADVTGTSEDVEVLEARTRLVDR